MSDIFVIPANLEHSKPPDMSNTLNLLKTYSTWKFQEVAAWMAFVYMYADQITIETMHLSQTLILNSCDTGLCEKVTNGISLLELEPRGGPTTFFIMTKHTVATTAKDSRAIVQHLQWVKLTGFLSKEVGHYLAVVIRIANRLTSCGKLPEDINDIIYDGLMTMTIYALRNYLTILHTTYDAPMKGYK
jgi:hypothetical protein